MGNCLGRRFLLLPLRYKADRTPKTEGRKQSFLMQNLTDLPRILPIHGQRNKIPHAWAARVSYRRAARARRMTQHTSPAISPPSEDVGAETGYRFGYQDSWAATLACSLIEESAEFTELYCEHHEDVLLKMVDGRFQGIQVKTRQLDGAHWKTDDEAVLGSLCRFSKLDAQFPNQFVRFVFATNHFFYQAGKTGKNLPHVLAEAAQATGAATAPTIVKRIVKQIATQTDRSSSDVLATLKKTICSDDLPKLNDSRKVLRESIIRSYAPAQDSIPSVIEKAAAKLSADKKNEAKGSCFLHRC